MKPCPHCGGKASVQKDGGFFPMVFVGCDDCGASGSYCENQEDAIKAWNERVPQTDLLRACQVALDALGCDRIRQDRLGAQEIIHAAVIKAKGES